MVAVQYMIRSKKKKKKIETDEKKIFIAARKMWVLLESVFLMILYSNEECAFRAIYETELHDKLHKNCYSLFIFRPRR